MVDGVNRQHQSPLAHGDLKTMPDEYKVILTGAFCASVCASAASNLAVASPPIEIDGGVHLNTYQPQLIPTAKQ